MIQALRKLRREHRDIWNAAVEEVRGRSEQIGAIVPHVVDMGEAAFAAELDEVLPAGIQTDEERRLAGRVAALCLMRLCFSWVTHGPVEKKPALRVINGGLA